MKLNKITEINKSLDFASYNMNGLIALFGYNDSSMIWYNQERALCMADCVIETMTELKEAIKNDDGKGGI